jgi:Gas vesicle protein
MSESRSVLDQRTPAGNNLADVLERVLDKGVVIVGDIQVRLLDIELLTIKIRLMIASVDRAREMGIDWWRSDPFVSSLAKDEDGNKEIDLDRRVAALEEKLGEEKSR